MPKAKKMDRYLISTEPWEVRFARMILIKEENDKFEHPTKQEMLTAIKMFNNSRKDVYTFFESNGYERLTKK